MTPPNTLNGRAGGDVQADDQQHDAADVDLVGGEVEERSM